MRYLEASLTGDAAVEWRISYRKLVETLRETRHTLEVLLTCDYCATCKYCNSSQLAQVEMTAIDAALDCGFCTQCEAEIEEGDK